MTSFGQQLRREREARGVSLARIAEATKIGARYLEAIENDQFDRLPGGVFDRGFVRAYAEAVGLDPEATVEAYLAERGARVTDAPDRTLEALRVATGTQPRRAGPRRLTLVVVAALVVATAAGLWIVLRPDRRPTPPAAEKDAPSVPRLAIPSEAAGEPSPVGPTASDAPWPATDPAVAAPLPVDSDPLAAPQADELDDEVVPVQPPRARVGRLEARIVIDRPVTGSLNCDNRRVEVLDGLRAGTRLELSCGLFLIVSADDGGALRIGLAGAEPVPLAGDGEPVHDRRLGP